MQVEFYRAATTALPRNHTISPDVGWALQSQGFLDFYVNSKLNWGFELLRDGKDMSEHERRFTENDGVYRPMVLSGAIAQWAIIDFRSLTKQVSDPERENFWFVSFSEDYTYCVIQRSGVPAGERVVLVGDNPQQTTA